MLPKIRVAASLTFVRDCDLQPIASLLDKSGTTINEYAKEFLESVLVKYNKRVVDKLKTLVDPVLKQEGVPIVLIIRGKNILNIRRDIMLNPRVSRLINLGA